MEQYLTLNEHREYAKRMDDEHNRQNHRINELEKQTAQNNKLLISVEKLALSVENMQKELAEQGEQLEVLKGRDGEMWRKVASYIITAVIGIVIGYIFKQIGIV